MNRGTALLLGVLTFSAFTASWAAAPPGLSPFSRLETDIRNRIAVEERALASPATRERARQTLQVLYYYLHDLRNHQTFWELWRAWPHSTDRLRVLYPGSGSHLAPLVFLFGDPAPKSVSYTYTELDPGAANRLDALLRVMERAGLLSGLSVRMGPIGPPSLEARWKAALAAPGGEGLSTDLGRFVPWFMEAAEGIQPAPGLMVEFKFRAGRSEGRILLLIGVRDNQAGSTEYYCAQDLAGADLLVTHDWDSAARGNLKVLYDVVESSRKMGRKQPLAIMMEDLRRLPQPVDLALFHPTAASSGPYGHLPYVTLPSGERLDTEDGEAVCPGGVILEPDLRPLTALTSFQLDSLFDLLLLAGPLFDRGNVDVVEGCRITAPLLLDLATGYGYREIHGMDLRGVGKGEFLEELARGAIDLLRSPLASAPGQREPLCALVSLFERTLLERADRDIPALLAQAARDRVDHPFLKNPKTRERFEAAYALWPDVVAQLERDSVEVRLAADLLDHERSRLDATCGPKG